jgi:hypothetical protein
MFSPKEPSTVDGFGNGSLGKVVGSRELAAPGIYAREVAR